MQFEHDISLFKSRTTGPLELAEVSRLQAATDGDARGRIVVASMCFHGRISGSSGAAALLGLKPTTLHAKMKKLGVRR